MPSTIIAIDGIPHKWNTANTIQRLANVLLVNFVSLGFGNPSHSFMSKKSKQVRHPYKTVYLRLPFGVDPYKLMDKLNRFGVPDGLQKFQVTAYIPTEVPENVSKAKPKGIPPQIRRFLKIRKDLPQNKAILMTYKEIMLEMQSKFTELYNLSKQTDHILLHMIGEIVHSRLLAIIDKHPTGNCFILSKNYRRIHPHFGDFELILNTYQQIVPEAHLNEKEMTAVSNHPYCIDNVPYDKIQAVCPKYSDKIVAKVSAYLKAMTTDIDNETDTEEAIAIKKVRAELKKLTPYMSAIVKQVVVENFIPRKTPHHQIKIYGEPSMPNMETLQPILKKFHAVHVMRSDRMYNLLRFNVPPSQYSSIIKLDGTEINGAKLIIRSADMSSFLPALNNSEPQGDEMMGCPDDDPMEGGELDLDAYEDIESYD